MDNGIYIMVSRENALFRALENASQNLANTETTGYQASRMLFTSYLKKDGNNGKMAFANDIATYRDLSQGSISVTGNPLDVAINGEGYFAVQTPLGERYTRSGVFTISTDGSLVTQEGYPVLDNGGQPITIPQEAKDIIVDGIGTVTVDGTDVGALKLVKFENPQTLRRAGEKLFIAEEQGQPVDATTTVQQGAIERSNVDAVGEVTRLIDINRALGLATNFVNAKYEMQAASTRAWTQQ